MKAELVPRVTYTDPEFAHVGLTEQEATEKRIPINVLRWSYHENDRAQAEHTTRGHIKVVTSSKGRILGATLAGAAAGELIQMWALALSQGLNIKAMTQWIAPFPTLGEINRRAAVRFYVKTPANPFVRRIIKFSGTVRLRRLSVLLGTRSHQRASSALTVCVRMTHGTQSARLSG